MMTTRILMASVAAIAILTPPALADVAPAAAKTASKSGIAYKADDDSAGPKELVDAIRARRGGKLLNLDRILLHSPNFAKAWNTMFGAVRGQLELSMKLRELAIMAISASNKAEYVWGQHVAEFLKAGGTKEQMGALQHLAAAIDNQKLFDETERATLALADEMTRKIAVAPATMKRVRAALPDEQVVELIGTIAAYNMSTRFVVATGIDME